MLLWIVFAGLTAGALVAVLWPFLFARRDDTGEGAFDTAIYRDQFDELKTDLERGLISASEAEAARTEISRRLLNTAENTSGNKDNAAATVPARRVSAILAMMAAVCVPALTLGFYLVFGSPGVPDNPLVPRLAKLDSSQQIDVLVKKVEARLQSHPEDGKGWDVIAPVYLRQRRYSDAADAYAKAIRLLGESTPRLVGHGEALVLSNNGIVTEAARRSFQQALAAGKNIPKARFWLGMAEEQDGDFGKAAQIWEKMLADAPGGAPWQTAVEQRLQIARNRLKGRPAPITKRGGSGAERRGPTREDIEAAEQLSAEERTAMINQMVDGLAARLQEDGGDLQGWLRLVRAYSVLGQRDKAGEALQSARKEFGQDQKALTALSEVAKELGL